MQRTQTLVHYCSPRHDRVPNLASSCFAYAIGRDIHQSMALSKYNCSMPWRTALDCKSFSGYAKLSQMQHLPYATYNLLVMNKRKSQNACSVHAPHLDVIRLSTAGMSEGAV